MEEHNKWIQHGFDDGLFLLLDALAPHLGGEVVAHHTSLPNHQNQVNTDPFVAQALIKCTDY